MTWDVFPGRKVVCVVDPHRWELRQGERAPEKGGVYVVRDVENGVEPGDACLYIRLIEIVNAPRRYDDGFDECNFDLNGFIPLDEREHDISDLVRVADEASRDLEVA